MDFLIERALDAVLEASGVKEKLGYDWPNNSLRTSDIAMLTDHVPQAQRT